MQNIKRILCVTDLSDVSKNAEIASILLSSKLNANLTILSCGEYYSHTPNNYFDESVIQPKYEAPFADDYIRFYDQKKLETKEHFDFISKKFNISLPENIIFEVKLENEVTAAIETIEENSNAFDLIVVGKQHNNFWEQLLFGSPAKEICDESHLSTLLIPSTEEWSMWLPKNIVVGCTLNERSQYAENFACDLGVELNTEVTLLHILDVNTINLDINVSHIFPIDYVPVQLQSEALDEIKKQRLQDITNIEKKQKENKPNLNIKSTIELGRIGDEILNYLTTHQNNNLLIIGSRGENAPKKFFLGSKTDFIEETCPIPLLVVQKREKK